MYPLKQKDLYDYDPRCIISSGLIFDYIIMDIIRNKKLARHNEEKIVFFHQLKSTSFICTGGHFKTFTGKRNLQLTRSSMCTYPFRKNRYKIIFNPHIKKQHFKWWYEWKLRPLVGFLWIVPQELYYYAFRIIKIFLHWRNFVHQCLITIRFH